MNAIDSLLNCNGNPVEFFENVDASRAEVDALRAETRYLRDVIEDQRGIIERLKTENLGLHRYLRQVNDGRKWTVTIDNVKGGEK